MKITSGFKGFFISPVTWQMWSYLQLPDLTTGKVWVGDENNRPVESSFTPLGSYLPFNQIFRGNEENVATPYPTILLQNLPPLGLTIVPDPTSPGDFIGQIYEGTDSGIPKVSNGLGSVVFDLGLINLRFLTGHFVMNNDGGNPALRVLMAASQWLEDLGVGITKLLPGGIFAIAVAGVDYVTPAQLEDAIAVLQDEIDVITGELATLQTQIDALNAEIVVINSEIDAIQAELVVIEADIAELQADVAALDAAVVALQDQVDAILAELVVINDEIDAIQAELVVITGDIATLQAQVVDIFAQLDTMEAEIAALAAAVAALSIDIDIVFGDIDELQDEIDDLQNQIDELRAAIQSLELQVDSMYQQMLAGFDTIFADLIALGEQIANLTVTLEGDVSGTGLLSSPIATTLNLTLDQIPTAANDVSMGNNKITDVAPGVAGTDAVNVNMLEAAVSGLDIVLEGFVEGGPAVDGVIETVRGPDCLLTNIPAGGDVDMDSNKINNLSMPSSAPPLQAVNAQFIWDILNGDVYVEWAA